MSRREPRASAAGAAQKDALHEFEQFKKKFLLANKHITKLNSSLSTRCQELETLVSTLNTENLRLHATMLSLYAELKREREKTIVAMGMLERTTMHALVQTFGNIRQELNIPPPPPKSPARSPPKVRRPDPALSPHANRLARPPDFSQIAEEDEGMEGNASPTPSPLVHRRRKSGGRSSGSSSSSGPLTSASRVSSATQPLAQLLPAPQIVTAIHLDIDDALLAPSTRKRIARRQSGLIGTPAPVPLSSHSLTPPRPPSPAFGSPMRRAAGLAEEAEENGLQDRDMPDAEADVEEQLARAAAAKKEKRRRLKALAVTAQGETEGESESARERERDRKERDREKERRRSRHEADEQGGGTGPLFSLKDVTNTAIGQGRTVLPPLEIPLNIQSRRYSTPEDSDVPTSAFTTSTRPTLTTPGTTPGPSHLPTPRTSSPPPIPHDPSPEPEPQAGGRERRVRRSVNYAEPKLNTKMRKPDPQPDAQPRRSSAAAAAPRTSVAPRASSSVADDVNVTVKRKRSRPQLPVNEDSDGDGDDDDGTQADEEYMPSRDWGGGITRRRSTQASSSRRAGAGMEERRHSTLI